MPPSRLEPCANTSQLSLALPHMNAARGRKGDKLTPHQAALLRAFDVKQAVFRMKLLAVWENDEVSATGSQSAS